jgi:DnaK suppressor protein
MARKDALLSLHKRLIAQRDDLRKKLGQDVQIGRTDGSGTSDLGDLATEDTEQEINSQLAAFESRELVRIEKAIEAMRDGRYGQCEGCGKSIPVARLRALPYTTTCVECQRIQEETGVEFGTAEADWESAWMMEARQSESDLTIRDFDVVVD